MAVDSKELDKLHSRLIEKNRKLVENNKYVMGKNPYILGKAQGKKPDNRMPVTLGKMAVDAMAGYAGKAGNIKVTYDLVSTDTPDPDDPFISYMRSMDDFNESDIEISELYEEGIEHGESYEIWWVSGKKEKRNGPLTTEYKIVPSEEMCFKYSNDLKKELLYAVHFIKDDDDMETAVVYYPLYQEEYIKIPGGGWKFENVEQHPFTTVPVNIYKTNRLSQCLFEAEKTYIDGIDEIYSKSMNEVDRFNAAIALFGNLLGKEFAEDFKNGNISMVEGLAEDGEGKFIPQYMGKDLSGIDSFYNQLMDRMETWFRKSVGIADFSDEAFAGQQSGIAILFKLIPMEFRAAQIETYFNQGLKRRLGYYGDVYNASTASVDVDDYTTIIKSERNIPVDEKAKVEILEKLNLLISKKTLLENMPSTIVPDVETELSRLEEEAAAMPDLIGDVEIEEAV